MSGRLHRDKLRINSVLNHRQVKPFPRNTLKGIWKSRTSHLMA